MIANILEQHSNMIFNGTQIGDIVAIERGSLMEYVEGVVLSENEEAHTLVLQVGPIVLRIQISILDVHDESVRLSLHNM